MSGRSGLLHTIAAVLGLIGAVAVIVAVLAGCGAAHHRAAWGYPPCKPGTHMAYIAREMICVSDGWHWPWS